jgi:YfiH family protein
MQNLYRFNNLTLQKCHHLISQKDSSAPYEYSFALHTQEDPEKILQNRHHLSEQYRDFHFIGAKQTHSTNVHVIENEMDIGWDSLNDAIENCDALITNRPKIMLTILTADCVPILLFDPIDNVVAAVHAGWKGTQGEILFKTVENMKQHFNCKPENILTGIGPSIGKCCYEVDWNVAEYFSNIKNSYLAKGEKYMLDLPFINKQQLLKAGLKEENIEMSNVCTSCENGTYFSYRKEGGCSGRFISIIGLK